MAVDGAGSKKKIERAAYLSHTGLLLHVTVQVLVLSKEKSWTVRENDWFDSINFLLSISEEMLVQPETYLLGVHIKLANNLDGDKPIVLGVICLVHVTKCSTRKL